MGPSLRLFCGGYKGNIAEGALVCNANCFWSPGRKLPDSANPWTRTPGVPARITWTAWRKAGHDQLSIVANPKLTEGRKTWLLAGNSPALKLGFKPYDWSICGPRPKQQRP